MKLKLNKSAIDLIKARISSKIRTSYNNSEIDVVKKEYEGKNAYVVLSNGKIFYDLEMKSLILNIFTRYLNSHYELDRKSHKKYGIHLSHIDNLLNLKVDEDTKSYLLKKMPIKKGDTVLELGAFRGFGTVKLSDLVGSTGKVIAIEAAKKNYEILRKNILANKITNVITVNKGVWYKEGRSILYQEKDQRTSLINNLLKNKKSEEPIDVDSIDNILFNLKIEKVDFITMEINGAEVEALKGMKRTISKRSIRLVSAGWYDYQGKPSCISLKKILEENGFQVHIGIQNRVFAIKE